MPWQRINAQGSPLVAEPDSIHLGTKSVYEAPFRFSFRLYNQSATVLKSVKFNSSCACSITKNVPSQLHPDEGFTLEVDFSPYASGAFSKDFDISYTYFGAKKKLKLKATGYIDEMIKSPDNDYPHAIGPLNFAHKRIKLGLVPNGGVAKKIVKVYNPSTTAVQVDSFLLPEYVELGFPKEKTFPAKQQSELVIFYHPELRGTYGSAEDEIRLFFDGKASPTSLILSSTIVAGIEEKERTAADRPRIEMQPAYKFGTSINEHVPSYASVMIKNIGGKTLTVYAIEGSSGVEVQSQRKIQIPPQAEVAVDVKLSDLGRKGEQMFFVHCYSNAPDSPRTSTTLILKRP